MLYGAVQFKLGVTETMSKVPCTKCGAAILEATAQRNAGLCIPCKNGTRESIEQGKRWYQGQREREKNDPLWKLWRDLVHRVHHTDPGFDGLSEPEKQYFAVGLLDGEVYNGGFDQYFSNSSGDYHQWAERGLEAMEALQALDLVRQAKQIVFGFSDVPKDRGLRQSKLMQGDNKSRTERLERIDEKYWKDPDKLSERSARFAQQHGLVQ
jgi:hypothetical protein